MNEIKPFSGVEDKIYLKDNAVPKFIIARQVPLALKDSAEKTLDNLVVKVK